MGGGCGWALVNQSGQDQQSQSAKNAKTNAPWVVGFDLTCWRDLDLAGICKENGQMGRHSDEEASRWTT